MRRLCATALPNLHLCRRYATAEAPNYFALFGWEPRFPLDTAALAKAARALQSECHPDKMVGKSPDAVREAQDKSAFINEGYETLRNPHTRATHLLSLKGVDTTNIVLAPEFLMEMLDVMELLSLVEHPDEAQRQQLQRQSEQFMEQQKAVLQQLEAAFEAGDLDRAAQLTGQLKFFINTTETIKEKLMGAGWVSTAKH
eukprot:EG_transcript_25197